MIVRYGYSRPLELFAPALAIERPISINLIEIPKKESVLTVLDAVRLSSWEEENK